jgi:hypothetical protein
MPCYQRQVYGDCAVAGAPAPLGGVPLVDATVDDATTGLDGAPVVVAAADEATGVAEVAGEDEFGEAAAGDPSGAVAATAAVAPVGVDAADEGVGVAGTLNCALPSIGNNGIFFA